MIFKEAYLTNLGFWFDITAMHVYYTDGGEKLSVSYGMEVQRHIHQRKGNVHCNIYSGDPCD